MKAGTRCLAFAALLAALVGSPAQALNTVDVPALSEAQIAYYLSTPAAATNARYGLKDSAGNTMDVPSVIQLHGQPYKYAAVYHTGSKVKGGIRFAVNLAASNDLMTWTFIGQLIDNADMAKLTRVPGSEWLVLSHEQWEGRKEKSWEPGRVAFKLFHSSADLMTRTIRGSYVMPGHVNKLNGTPSVYDLRRSAGGDGVDGHFGFHFWTGKRDVNGVVQITGMFGPPEALKATPWTATAYNDLFIANRVTGNIGDRDTLVTTDGRYNVQEGNLGRPARSWDKWTPFLYKFAERSAYPDGSGSLTRLMPRTPGGSRSFGNPIIAVLDRPNGPGKALVVSYFLFGEGAAPGEGGSLLYYFDI